MRNIPLRPLAIVACSIAILCSSVVARAQSVDGGFDPGANQIVNTIAVQPDGKTVVGGNFTGLGGATGTTVRNRIGRLNVDGTVDSFNPGTNGPVHAVAVQPDGKILAGGNFTAVGGGTGTATARSHIARFNADGTVDTSFDPGANLNVYALAVQSDGKILVGGNFSRLGGGGVGITTRIGIGRLNADGSVDTAFDPGASKIPSPGAPPRSTPSLLQPDGKILVGGYFNGLGGGTGTTARNFLGRLLADGTVDSFNPGVTSISGVNALALQADGKILVGGTFTRARRGESRQHRPARRQRLARQRLQSWRGNSGPHAGRAGRWEDPRRRLLQVAGRRRRNPAGRCATTSGGSTLTAPSMAPSIRARTTSSTPWPCRGMGRSWPGASSTISATARLDGRNASQPCRAAHEHGRRGSDADALG